MNPIALIAKNLWHKKLTLLMSVLLLLFGTAVISMLLLIEKSIANKLDNDLRGADLVVGAKGSPAQLVLSAIYHTEAPTGNVSWPEVQQIARNPLVEWCIPLSYGDTYQGSRIVGTSHEYIKLYGGSLKKGRLYTQPMEVVVGFEAARKAAMDTGHVFAGTHGEQGEVHEEKPYRVVGILHSTGTILDHLILSNIETVWEVHRHEEGEEGEQHAQGEEHTGSSEQQGHSSSAHGSGEPVETEGDEQQITAALLKFRSPMALMTLPRIINSNTNMQAANPVIEVRRLMRLVSIGADTLRAIGAAIVALSALGIFITLYLRLKERQYEMALMRSLGCPRWELVWLLLGEGLVIAWVGALLGLVAGRVGLWLLEKQSQGFYLPLSRNFLAEELWMVLIVLGIGALAALIPAARAFYLNISKTLADEV
jgi:putative ABC transport system permease protein